MFGQWAKDAIEIIIWIVLASAALLGFSLFQKFVGQIIPWIILLSVVLSTVLVSSTTTGLILIVLYTKRLEKWKRRYEDHWAESKKESE